MTPGEWNGHAPRQQGKSAPELVPDKLTRLWWAAKLPIHDLLTTFFPSDCRVCWEPLLRSGRLPVCEQCLRAPKVLSGSRCYTCSDLLGFESERTVGRLEAAERRCTPCRLAEPGFDRAVSAAVYDGEMRELLHLLKYGGVRELARPLGQRLAEIIATLAPELPDEEILLVPVPLFQDRRRERGFNQATELAEAARVELRRRLPEVRLRLAPGVLRRTRATKSQFELTPRQRRTNVRGAFATARAEAGLRERSVVLVDDIFTTGATARACAAALRRGGARKVWVATVARAEPETVALWGDEDT